MLVGDNVMCVVPGGQGKSRIAAITAFLFLMNDPDKTSKVHLVYSNTYLKSVDERFHSKLFDYVEGGRVEYHVGLPESVAEKDIIILDEADSYMYQDPAKFFACTQKCTVLFLSATMDYITDVTLSHKPT